jgi:hypothetical protein
MTLDQVLGPLRAVLPFVTTMFMAWGPLALAPAASSSPLGKRAAPPVIWQ